MTSAALGAEALDECLRRQRGAVPLKRLRERIAAAADAPWDISTGGDLCYPEVQGPRGAGHAFISWYVTKVQEVSSWDPLVFTRFGQATHLNRSPASLFAPAVLGRVLSFALFGKSPEKAPVPVLAQREG
jgi:hypothetical protein